MTDTTFTNGLTQTDENWFNDLNNLNYNLFGDPSYSSQIFTVNSSNGDLQLSTDLEVGDPGLEEGGVSVNGTTYDAKIRISDIGGTKPAQAVLHRHSTTLQSVLLGTRSNSDTSSHADVTNSMPLFTIYGGGWTGSHYDLFGSIDFNVDSTGTVSATSSPGQIQLKTTPDGSNTPTTAVTIDSSQNIGIGISTPDTLLHVWNGSAGTVSAFANTLLTLENSTHAYINFLTPNTSLQAIKFGDPEDTDAGQVIYDHSSDALTLKAASANALQVDGNATAGNTRLLIYDVNSATLERVKVGANATGPGGVGRALYVDNV